MDDIKKSISKFFDQFLAQTIIAFDKEGKILYCSMHTFEKFKLIPEDIKDREIRSIVEEHSIKKLEQFLFQLDLEVGKYQFVDLILKLDLQQVKLTARKVIDEEQNFVFNLGILEDINELKKLENKYFNLNHKFKQLQSNAHIGFWNYDLPSQNLVWSDEVFHIHDMGLGQEITLPQAIELFYPYDREKFQDIFELCLFEGENFDLELRAITKSNNLIWLRVKGEPIYQVDDIIGCFGSIQDITKFKNLQYELAKESHTAIQHKQFIDSFAIVVKTDIHGKINYVNDKFCEISKYEEKELLGQDHRILNSGHHDKSFFKNMWETIQSGKPWRGEIKNRAKDGTYYWVNTYITPIVDNSGIYLGYMAMRFDITHEKELEEQLGVERERATISAQLASVGEMSTGIVHEINNPLSVIAGMNALLPKKLNDEQALLKIHKATSNAIERMYHIIKGLKRLSHKSDQDKFEIVPLIDLLEDSLGFIQESLKYNHINFKLGDMPYDVVLECREVEISQVLLNLVNNARDAINESNTEEKWIDVSFENLENIIQIRVTDSGPGIPPEIQDKIMEQFFTTKKVGKGTGLGLSLSARILKDHGGRLYLDKNANRTTFVIELPKKLDAMAS